jgi:hypothetical protein
MVAQSGNALGFEVNVSADGRLKAHSSGLVQDHNLSYAIKRKHLPRISSASDGSSVMNSIPTELSWNETGRSKFLARTTAQMSITFCRVAKAQDEQKRSCVVNGRNKNGGHAIPSLILRVRSNTARSRFRANEPNVTSHPAPAVPQQTRRAASQPTAAAVLWRSAKSILKMISASAFWRECGCSSLERGKLGETGKSRLGLARLNRNECLLGLATRSGRNKHPNLSRNGVDFPDSSVLSSVLSNDSTNRVLGHGVDQLIPANRIIRTGDERR